MRKYSFLLIQTLLLIFCQYSKGDVSIVGLPETVYYSKQQYKGGTQNWSITQSNNDKLYFGNNKGLLVFDGEKWFLTQDMKEDLVRAVKRVGSKIYVGGYQSIGFYKEDAFSQLSYTPLPLPSELNSIENIWNIFSFKGQIVFHSERAILIYEKDRLVRIIPAFSSFKGAFKVKDRIFVYDEKNGLFELIDGQLKLLPHSHMLKNKKITTMLSMPGNRIFIGTYRSGGYIFHSDKIKTWDNDANKRLIKANIFCGSQIGDDFFVFGTIQSGVVITNMNGKILSIINKDRGLKNNTVLSLFVDRQKNIWCGLNNGIAKINIYNPISYIGGYFNIGTGYDVTAYHRYYYFATNQALYRVEKNKLFDATLDRKDFYKIDGSEGQNWSLYSDNHSLLLAHDLGVFSLDGNKLKKITPAHINGIWRFKPIPNHSDLLMAGTYKGLIVLQKKDGKWRYSHSIQGIKHSINNFFWDKSGKLWMVMGEKGVLKIEFDKDYQKIMNIDTLSPKLFSLTESSLFLSKVDNQIIIYNPEGIYKMDNLQTSVLHLSQYERLFKKEAFPLKIKEDQNQNVWFFQESQPSVLRTLEDGTQKRMSYPFVSLRNRMVEYFHTCYTTDEGDHTFINVEDGFAHYSPLFETNFKYHFKLNILGFSRLDPLNQHKSKDSIFKQHVVFPYKRINSFNVRFAATDFNDHQVVYHTTLLQNNDTLSSTSNVQPYREFLNLRAGNYRIDISATNKYEITTAVQSVYFTIAPPWYWSNMSKLVYITLLILLLYLGYFFLMRKEKKAHHKILNQYVEDFKQKESLFEQEKLHREMEFKEKELSTLTKHIAQKNDFLNDIHSRLGHISRLQDVTQFKRKLSLLQKQIDKDMHNEKYWESFNKEFEQIHHSFITKLKEKHPDLTEKEQKLSAYIKLGTSSKEIAILMNVTSRTVENYRYKLRQHFGLKSGDSLSEYIQSL